MQAFLDDTKPSKNGLKEITKKWLSKKHQPSSLLFRLTSLRSRVFLLSPGNYGSLSKNVKELRSHVSENLLPRSTAEANSHTRRNILREAIDSMFVRRLIITPRVPIGGSVLVFTPDRVMVRSLYKGREITSEAERRGGVLANPPQLSREARRCDATIQ